MNRRTFLRKNGCAALGYAGVMNALAQMRMIHNASAALCEDQQIDDYKALVCIFLYGGNDSNNLLIPTGDQHYADYLRDRGKLAVEVGNPDAHLDLGNDPADDILGRSFRMHPDLSEVHQQYKSGQIAVVANVGTLTEPINTKEAYLQGAVSRPPQLFSHTDQQLHWQSSIPDQPFATGWGGRMADQLWAANAEAGAQASMSVSLAGHTDFMVGSNMNAVQLHMTAAGPLHIENYGTAAQQGQRLQTFDNVMTNAVSNLFAKAYQEKVAQARYNNDYIKNLLDGSEFMLPAGYPGFPATPLGGQLKMIANMIALRRCLKQKRQVFFAGIGGFDTHANQFSSQPALMEQVSTALGAFYNATVALGVASNVTTFTASDFNRTYTPNGTDDGAGSDHAWGGHALVMGGAVDGNKIFGKMPDTTLGSEDDTEVVAGSIQGSRGRWIPKISVDQYAATLAKWFGLEDHLDAVFPNLHRFENQDLGFML